MEVSEEKANQRVEEFKKQLKTLTVKLKEAEARAEFAEKTVKKLQKEVDRLEGQFSKRNFKEEIPTFSFDFIASICFLQILFSEKRLNIMAF